MTDKNHCPYPRKQSAPPLIPSNPDSDATKKVQVVDAIDFLRQYGLRVVVSRHASYSEEPRLQRVSPRFLKLETVSAQTGMGKSTILAWEATGRFPRAVRLSATLRLWLQEDVDNWIRDQHAKAVSKVQS
jgi:predicted DNA-binding transcriptional regulator AlpA